jgi:GGDEF domain-containing protein
VQKVGSERWPTTPVTASIGIAVTRSDDDVTALLRRADEQAYAAKRAGGNRAVAAPRDLSPDGRAALVG